MGKDTKHFPIGTLVEYWSNGIIFIGRVEEYGETYVLLNLMLRYETPPTMELWILHFDTPQWHSLVPVTCSEKTKRFALDVLKYG